MEFALRAYTSVYQQVLENAVPNAAARRIGSQAARSEAGPIPNAGDPISAGIQPHGRVKRGS
jgi:hypothetical protein